METGDKGRGVIDSRVPGGDIPEVLVWCVVHGTYHQVNTRALKARLDLWAGKREV